MIYYVRRMIGAFWHWRNTQWAKPKRVRVHVRRTRNFGD
jgi:hypothetical protein